MGEMKDVPEQGDGYEERPRRRGPEHGRVIVHLSHGTGRWLTEQAEDLGISPATFVRMLVVEALKGRGLTPKQLDEQYGRPNYGPDKRVNNGKPKVEAGEPVQA
jgi:hypothetical protein